MAHRGQALALVADLPHYEMGSASDRLTTVAAHARAAEREALIPLLHCTDLLRMAVQVGRL
jgi:hypothetical protein